MAKDINAELEAFDKKHDQDIAAELEAFDTQDEGPNLEESLGFNRFYGLAEKAAKIVGPLAKPITVPMATVLETATEGPAAGAEALKGELSQLQPTAKSSMAYQLNKIPGMNEPIMETPGKDVLQGEKTKAMAKLWLQKNFPKAYEFASKATPGDVVGATADIGLGEAVAPYTTGTVNKGLKRVGGTAFNKAVSNSEKAIERMSSLSGENAAEASNTLRTRKAAITAMEYGLTNKLKNPEEFHLALSGERQIVPDKLTGKKSVKASGGLIDGLTEHVNELADEAGKSTGPLDIKKIENDVYNTMAQKLSDPNSGATWNPEIATGLRQRINNFFKTTPHDLSDAEAAMMAGRPEEAMAMQGEYNKGNMRDFKSVVKLKRAAADKVYEINKNPEIYGVEGATDKAVFKEIWDQIDNKVNQIAKGGNEAAGSLVKYNSDLSDMLHLKNMTQNARLEGLSSLSLPEMILGTAATTAAASAVGMPMGGLAYVPARAAMKMSETNFPAYMAPIQHGIADISKNAISGVNQLSKAPARAVGLGMASSGRIGQINLPLQLVKYQIPRNSSEILANKDVVIAKIAQMSNNPVMTDMFKDALEEHPEKLPKVLPALVLQFPDLFEPDDYNRIDGKILDPQLKQKALKDIQNDRTMDIREKAFKSKRLQEEGIL